MLQEALARIRKQLSQAAQKSGRSVGDITIVAATKNVPLDTIKDAVRAGIPAIGENRVQEAASKLRSKEDVPAEWHFIGHLQTNKAKTAVRLFDMIQSLDSIDLAERLNTEARALGKIQQSLVQIRVSSEPKKFGIPVEHAAEFLETASRFDHLHIAGMMMMAPHTNNPEDTRAYFRKASECFQRMKSLSFPHVTLEILSMGMSNDFSVAVEEGATMVRIGTALFGERPVRT